jgi:4-phosphopantoate--beta-alanine ligase
MNPELEMTVPRSHPRYISLTTRDRLVEGWKNGLVVTQGLIAHGRGEAFDYLIGEQTTEEAQRAIDVAAASTLLSERPVISVNGNVGALSANGIRKLTASAPFKVEVNIFHRTEDRVRSLVTWLKDHGINEVLGAEPDERIPGLDHDRALCCSDGIYGADLILVPLEDGDRCIALKKMGKKVVTIDLNPLSRTAQTADITIVDNVIRAIPALVSSLDSLKGKGSDELESIVEDFDNTSNINRTLKRISGRF